MPSAVEVDFLALGEGAAFWLVEAAAADTPRMRVQMSEALAWAKLFDPGEVDWALGHAAVIWHPARVGKGAMPRTTHSHPSPVITRHGRG